MEEGSGSNQGGGGMALSSHQHNNFIYTNAAELDLMDASPASGVAVEREHMFDKVVTPSDVGKLNRLVIPKQHAEKYFPLDSSTNYKGLLLNFEDRTGKPWRFRYSYWNSSQSYVMTKGWSRFVKDKKLDAGDIVSFQRGLGDLGKDRLFIDWRRRPDPHPHPHELLSSFLPPPHPHFFPSPYSTPLMGGYWDNGHGPAAGRGVFLPAHGANLGGDPRYFPHNPTTTNNYNQQGGGGGPPHYGTTFNPSGSSVIYFRSTAAAAAATSAAEMMRFSSGGGISMMDDGDHDQVFESVPLVVQGKAAAKRLRLFGVNMDCPISNDSDDDHHHHNDINNILPSTTVLDHNRATLMLAPPPPPPHLVQLRLYNNGSSSPLPSPTTYNARLDT